MGGIWGGICAVSGITAPAVTILSVITLFYNTVKDNVLAASALRGIRSAVVPIIACAAFSLGKEAFKTKLSLISGSIALLLCLTTDLGNIELILLGIGAAFLCQAIHLLYEEH